MNIKEIRHLTIFKINTKWCAWVSVPWDEQIRKDSEIAWACYPWKWDDLRSNWMQSLKKKNTTIYTRCTGCKCARVRYTWNAIWRRKREKMCRTHSMTEFSQSWQINKWRKMRTIAHFKTMKESITRTRTSSPHRYLIYSNSITREVNRNDFVVKQNCEKRKHWLDADPCVCCFV